MTYLIDPIGLMKLLFVSLATLMVFTPMFSSWLLATRLVFALTFVSSCFVSCLTPEDRMAWSQLIHAVDLTFYSMVSGVLGMYAHSKVSQETLDISPDSTQISH